MSSAFPPAPKGLKAPQALEGPLGLFGGTFDPIHHGHLRLAEEAISHLHLGGLTWIPAGQPPHRGAPRVTPQHRLDMVHLATADHPLFQVDDAEVLAAQPSYTVLTLERLRQQHGHRPLVLLVGADAFAGLPGWHRWADLLHLAHIAVAHRPGFPIQRDTLPPALAERYAAAYQPDPTALRAAPAGSICTFAMTQLAISATQIRTLLANGASPRYLLPATVIDYIARHQLYTSA